mgnify:CR=1 FL=1
MAQSTSQPNNNQSTNHDIPASSTASPNNEQRIFSPADPVQPLDFQPDLFKLLNIDSRTMLDKLLNAMVRSDEEDEEEDIQFIAGESASFEYSNHPANNNPVTPAANPVDSQITKKKRKKKKKKSSSETKSQEVSQQLQQASSRRLPHGFELGDPKAIEYYRKEMYDYLLGNTHLFLPENYTLPALFSTQPGSFSLPTRKNGDNETIFAIEDIVNIIVLEGAKILTATINNSPTSVPDFVDPDELTLHQRYIHYKIFQEMQTLIKESHETALRQQNGHSDFVESRWQLHRIEVKHLDELYNRLNQIHKSTFTNLQNFPIHKLQIHQLQKIQALKQEHLIKATKQQPSASQSQSSQRKQDQKIPDISKYDSYIASLIQRLVYYIQFSSHQTSASASSVSSLITPQAHYQLPSQQQQQQQQQQQPSHSSQQSQHTPRVQHQHIHDQHDPKDKKSNDDKIWDTSTAEERQRINQFWLSLTEDERRELVKIDKDTVMEKMREQKRTNCNCTVCGRKRMAIEELESLYEAYNDTKSGDPDDDESRRVDHFNFGNNLTIKGGILTVAEDLLKNDGKKFIDMMESLAEKRMRREEEIEALAADYIWEGTEEDYDEDPLTSDEVEYDDDDDDDDDDDEDDLDDDDELDDDEDEEDNDDEEYDETVDNEESRWAESKRLLQMFAAKMFEQRVMAAYRERVANERQRKFLEELEEETRLKEEREAKKQRDKEKKKNKKRQQKLAKEEEKARREAEKAEAEAQLKAKQAEKQEEARRRKHEQKLKKEAERKQLEVEKRLKADEEKQKEAERKLEKQRRIQQEREAKETAKRLAEETAERKRQEQEQKAAKEAELIKKEAELAHQEAAKIKQQHQKQLLQQLQQHAQQIGAVNIVKGSESKSLTPIARKADPVLLASLQQSSLAKQQQQFQQQQQPSVMFMNPAISSSSVPTSSITANSLPSSSIPLLQQPFSATPHSPVTSGWASPSPSLAQQPHLPDALARRLSNTQMPIVTNGPSPLLTHGIPSLYSTGGVIRSPPSVGETLHHSPTISTPPSIAPIRRPTSGNDHEFKPELLRLKKPEVSPKQMGSSALLADDEDDDDLLPGNILAPRSMSLSSPPTPIPRSRNGSIFSVDPFDGSSTGAVAVGNGWNPLMGSIRRGSMWSSSNNSAIRPSLLNDSIGDGANGSAKNSGGSNLNSLSGIGGGSTPNLSVDLLQQTTFKVYQHHAMRSADGFVPAHMLYRATIATLQAPSVSSAGPVNSTAAATAAASETLNMQDFYHILGNSSAVMEGGLVIQLVRDNFGLVTQVKYVEAQQQPQTEQPMQYQQVHQQQQRYMYGGSSVIPNAAPATTVLPMGY